MIALLVRIEMDDDLSELTAEKVERALHRGDVDFELEGARVVDVSSLAPVLLRLQKVLGELEAKLPTMVQA